MGSELSISEACNKTDGLSESSDSLQSFEKHEMSESESTQNFEDDSLRGMGERHTTTASRDTYVAINGF